MTASQQQSNWRQGYQKGAGFGTGPNIGIHYSHSSIISSLSIDQSPTTNPESMNQIQPACPDYLSNTLPDTESRPCIFNQNQTEPFLCPPGEERQAKVGVPVVDCGDTLRDDAGNDSATSSSSGSGLLTDRSSLQPWIEDKTDPDPHAGYRTEHLSKLNRADFEEVMRHRKLIGYTERSYLNKVRDKLEIYPKRFPDREAYLAQSGILVLSPGWSSAQKYSNCGIRSPINKAGICNLHKFCSYCAYLRGQKNKLTYGPAFDSGTWRSITGSFSGDLLFDGSAASSHSWLHYWDAYKAGFSRWFDENTVRGVAWTEELAVNSLYPTRVNPHVHAIVDADEITDEDVERLSRFVGKYLDQAIDADHLEADVKVEPVSTARNLVGHLGYMFKPLKLVRPYETAFARACQYDRAGVQQLNSATTDLVLAYCMVSRRRPDPKLGYEAEKSSRTKINSIGTLDSRRKKSFIGIHEKAHDQHREWLRRIEQEAEIEYIEGYDSGDEDIFLSE